MNLNIPQGWVTWYPRLLGVAYSKSIVHGNELLMRGPWPDGDLEIFTIHDPIANEPAVSKRWIPMAVLANHLRLAGWTVLPPEGWDPQ